MSSKAEKREQEVARQAGASFSMARGAALPARSLHLFHLILDSPILSASPPALGPKARQAWRNQPELRAEGLRRAGKEPLPSRKFLLLCGKARRLTRKERLLARREKGPCVEGEGPWQEGESPDRKERRLARKARCLAGKVRVQPGKVRHLAETGSSRAARRGALPGR
jgi:hypothetical protein